MNVSSTSKLFDLSGQVALVTGAARGIGEAIALRLADAGAAVVACDVNAEGVEAIAQKIAAKGGRSLAVRTDLTCEQDLEQLVQRTVESLGGIDLLVNNAGLRDWFTWDTLTPAHWDRFMNVNVKAVFFLSQSVARQMIKQGRGGSIVNIASTAAVIPVRWKVDYNAAKAAVVQLSKSLARELGEHRIRVNAVGPGGTRTPGGSGSIPDSFSPELLMKMGAEWRARQALPIDMLDPDDIARAVLFFCSDAARYVTGQALYVDAGYLVG